MCPGLATQTTSSAGRGARRRRTRRRPQHEAIEPRRYVLDGDREREVARQELDLLELEALQARALRRRAAPAQVLGRVAIAARDAQDRQPRELAERPWLERPAFDQHQRLREPGAALERARRHG